jgi:protein-L-isoaspartate(D-aspartate) O-methyltransferase
MAIMLEQLGLQPGQGVLEIGAGTGYNAALMAQIVGPGGTLSRSTSTRTSSCWRGSIWQPRGSIASTSAAPMEPRAIRRGRPSIGFERHQNHLESVSVADCGFMPLRGDFAGPQRVVPLSHAPGPFVAIEGDRPIDASALSEAIKTAPVEMPTGLAATVGEACGSLSLWLALEDPDSCLFSIYADPSVVDRSAVPLLVEWSAGDMKQRSTRALLGKEGLAALARPPDGAANNPEGPAALSIVSLRAERELVERLLAGVVAWHEAGRPRTDDLRISAYPKGQRAVVQPENRVLEKRWTTLVVSRA